MHINRSGLVLRLIAGLALLASLAVNIIGVAADSAPDIPFHKGDTKWVVGGNVYRCFGDLNGFNDNTHYTYFNADNDGTQGNIVMVANGVNIEAKNGGGDCTATETLAQMVQDERDHGCTAHCADVYIWCDSGSLASKVPAGQAYTGSNTPCGGPQQMTYQPAPAPVYTAPAPAPVYTAPAPAPAPAQMRKDVDANPGEWKPVPAEYTCNSAVTFGRDRNGTPAYTQGLALTGSITYIVTDSDIFGQYGFNCSPPERRTPSSLAQESMTTGCEYHNGGSPCTRLDLYVIRNGQVTFIKTVFDWRDVPNSAP